jgi:Cu-processing system ATP-binding protein
MIEVHGLEKRFGAVTALGGLSFDVAPGETFALLGPNGSGKTTTLKCLSGLFIPSAGRIRIDGMDVVSDPVACRAKISYLPQRVAFPEQVTARETLNFFCRLRNLPPTRVSTVLERCVLGDAADRLVSEFSGGMIQRLGVAVAILAEAPILLLDEPTASLDLEAAATFRAFLASLKELGKTIVFSSHVLSDVDLLADRVGILVGGCLRAIETVAALRDSLNTQSLLQVRVNKSTKRLCDVATAAGGSSAHCSHDRLTIFAAPGERYRILRALEEAGAEIIGFSTVEPPLEDIYLRYIHEESVDLSLAGRRGVREPVASAG